MKTLNARGLLAAVVAVFVTAMVGLGLVAGPASAHSGGKAIVLVEDFSIAPAGGGWTATAVLADFDGGGALRAVDVQVNGAGLTKLTPMVESDAPGTYTLALPKAAPGPVTVELDIRTLPGGTPVTPFKKSYSNTLVDGQKLSLASGKASPADGGGGSNTGMIAGVAGAVLLVAVLYGVFAMRKRTAVPAK